MKVCVEPTGWHSHAMVRIARALERSAPAGVEIVRDRAAADLVVIYAIDDVDAECALLTSQGKRYAIVQCCLQTAAGRPEAGKWVLIWAGAACVWSYYDLSRWVRPAGFYHAPLGVDEVFQPPADPAAPRRRLVVTTGFVSGPSAEAIEEVHAAAALAGFEAVHVGPPEVPGVLGGRSLGWLPDSQLAALYRQAAFVASLRHVEGFELPAAEAAACGAVPIVFQQPATAHWYADLALFVPDCSGEPLVGYLRNIFDEEQRFCELLREQRGVAKAQDARRRFDWPTICAGFWKRVTKRAEVAA